MIRRFRCLLIVVALCGLAVASASAPTAFAAAPALHHGLANAQMIHVLHTLRAEMIAWSHTVRWFVPTPRTGAGLAHHLIGRLIVKHPFPPPQVVQTMPVGLRGGI